MPESLTVPNAKTGASEQAGLEYDGRGDGPCRPEGGRGDGDREGRGVAPGVALNVNDVLDGVLTPVLESLVPLNVKTPVSEAARLLAAGKGGAVDRAAEPKKATAGAENREP